MDVSSVTELKIVFAGPMGAGKTTAIQSVSSIPPLRTEVVNSDFSESQKSSTTVALDYGEVVLKDDLVLKLFGTPGQLRFQFMWRSLAQGALGLIILLDNTRPSPLSDLALYLDGFKDLAMRGRLVIGVGRMDGGPGPLIHDYRVALEGLGYSAPILRVDVRVRADVVTLLDLLFSQIEFDPSNNETISE